MPYFYANTDRKFFWNPFCRISIEGDTAIVHVDDFIPQRYDSNLKRFGYSLMGGGSDSAVSDLVFAFDEDVLKRTLLCLTEYPIVLNGTAANPDNLSYWNPNPWHSILKFAQIDIEQVANSLKAKYPGVKKISTTTRCVGDINFTLSEGSPIMRFLAKAGIAVETQLEYDSKFQKQSTTTPLYSNQTRSRTTHQSEASRISLMSDPIEAQRAIERVCKM